MPRMVTMAIVHDIAECIATDIVTATLTLKNGEGGKASVRMRDLFCHDNKCYHLWLGAREHQARILAQLDKLDAPCRPSATKQDTNHGRRISRVHAGGALAPGLKMLTTGKSKRWRHAPT